MIIPKLFQINSRIASAIKIPKIISTSLLFTVHKVSQLFILIQSANYPAVALNEARYFKGVLNLQI